MSIAYAPAQARYLVQITVPLEVALAKGVMIQAGSYTSPKMIYRRCANDGCVVEGPVDAAIITALTQAGDTAKMVIVSRDGKTINLPMSLKGFPEALDSMKSQAQQKAQK
jgi:invasion protein IalB